MVENNYQNAMKFQNLLLFRFDVSCCLPNWCCSWSCALCDLWIAIFVLAARFDRRLSQVQIITINAHTQTQLSKIGVQNSFSMPRLSNEVASLCNNKYQSHRITVQHVWSTFNHHTHILVFKCIRLTPMTIRISIEINEFKGFVQEFW